MTEREKCNACGKMINPMIDGLKDDPFDVGFVCFNCYKQIKVEIMTIISEWNEQNGLETSVEMEGELTDAMINKFDEIIHNRVNKKKEVLK